MPPTEKIFQNKIYTRYVCFIPAHFLSLNWKQTPFDQSSTSPQNMAVTRWGRMVELFQASCLNQAKAGAGIEKLIVPLELEINIQRVHGTRELSL